MDVCQATIARESLTAALIAELSPLLAAHWHEVAHYADIPLEPDWERYRILSANGNLRVYVARVEGGQLVGYLAVFVTQNLHYASSKVAAQDVLFVAESHRRAHLGSDLLVHAEHCLRAEGVQVFTQHCKAAEGKTIQRFLERRHGYELVDLVLAKRLDR